MSKKPPAPVQVTLYAPPEIAAEVERLALEQRRSKSAQALVLLEEALQARRVGA